mgnify:CR=1 FL=1
MKNLFQIEHRIAPDDKYAERRRADMTRRLNDLYDQIYKAEDLL